jgi:hypothetical protein
LFNEAMVSLTWMAVPAVLPACDFSGISILMDVRGGFGEPMSEAIPTPWPELIKPDR